MKTQKSPSDKSNKIILYTAADGKVTADVFLLMKLSGSLKEVWLSYLE